MFHHPATSRNRSPLSHTNQRLAGLWTPVPRLLMGRCFGKCQGPGPGTEIEADEALALPTRARRCTQLKGANHEVGVDEAVRGGTGIMDHGSYRPEHSTCERLSNASNPSTGPGTSLTTTQRSPRFPHAYLLCLLRTRGSGPDSPVCHCSPWWIIGPARHVKRTRPDIEGCLTANKPSPRISCTTRCGWQPPHNITRLMQITRLHVACSSSGIAQPAIASVGGWLWRALVHELPRRPLLTS